MVADGPVLATRSLKPTELFACQRDLLIWLRDGFERIVSAFPARLAIVGE